MNKEDTSDKELDNLLNQLSKSVRGPRGKYTAENSYPQLQERLPLENRKRILPFRYIAVASIAIVLVLSTYILLNNSHSPEMLIVKTKGDTKEVVLPDGSHVILNHYSSLQYPSEFNRKDRTVILSGEAYFDITKQKEHPFYVHSEDICITVLGTQFNVQSYSYDPCIKTTLIKGKVAISLLDKVKTTILAPNETAYFSKQTGEIYKETTENVMNEIAWREGKLIFENKPLAEITTDLSNYFNVQIKIDNQYLQTYKMTARFEQNENIEEILNILKMSADFNWKREENNTIVITPNN